MLRLVCEVEAARDERGLVDNDDFGGSRSHKAIDDMRAYEPRPSRNHRANSA